MLLADQMRNVNGMVVECGTWKGGTIAGMARVLGDGREYVLFDSFEGLPPAREIDGETALSWQADTESPQFYDNCRADEVDAIAAMDIAGVKNYDIVKGWFDQSVPSYCWKSPIAILRLDGDWYNSTLTCLEHLFPRVQKNGIIIIDDYYDFEGCSKAVHDYLSKKKRSECIRQFIHEVCYLMKQ